MTCQGGFDKSSRSPPSVMFRCLLRSETATRITLRVCIGACKQRLGLGVRGGLFESPGPLHEGHSHEIEPCRPWPALSRHALYHDIGRGFAVMELRGILCELT